MDPSRTISVVASFAVSNFKILSKSLGTPYIIPVDSTYTASLYLFGPLNPVTLISDGVSSASNFKILVD